MKILVVEDDQTKRDVIRDYVVSLGVSEADVRVAKDMAEFVVQFDSEVALCVIDLRLPAYAGAENNQNGIGILQSIEAKAGGRVRLLAISAYPEEFSAIRQQFEARGCMLVDYQQRDVWENVLKQMIIEVQSAVSMDFLVFCALRSERAPYTGFGELNGVPVFKEGLSRYDITIAGRRGCVIEMPHMGLVDAAITAGRCIEKFKPKVVSMSGVCGGFEGQAELGQLLVAELAYEYQSGKWTNDGFSQEPYQVPISEDMRVLTRELLEDSNLLARLELDWKSHRPKKMSDPTLATFTSGSAVIANEKYMNQVANHHRRVAGLDMEVYALMRAVHLARCKPDVICAKTVVDLANSSKDDELQPYGAMISARFVVEVLERYFSTKD